jgi:hypothetical protein
MKRVRSYETSRSTYLNTQRNIQEDLNPRPPYELQYSYKDLRLYIPKAADGHLQESAASIFG